MKFSVLIAVYDKEKPANFQIALTSIIDQTLAPNEIVLVVDGPISTSLENIIDDFNSQHPGLFQIIRLPENVGLGIALQQGVMACKYEIVARMDTDDISLPNRFEKQINFLKARDTIAVVGANVEEFQQIPGDIKVFKHMPEKGEELIAYAKYRNPMNHPSIIFRKTAVIAAGNYSGEIRLFEDYLLFIRMLQLGHQFYNMQEVLLYFRVGDRLENIKRRSGLHYLKKEIRFLLYAKRIKYLSDWEFIRALITKPVIRLLPMSIIIWVYKTFLRAKA